MSSDLAGLSSDPGADTQAHPETDAQANAETDAQADSEANAAPLVSTVARNRDACGVFSAASGAPFREIVSASATGDRSWYCVRTQPKHEHIAAARLRTIDEVDVFSPRMRFKRATRRGLRWFTEAMFPGYLFARFDFAAHFREVHAANGVSGIVRFGQQYAVVADSIIAELQRHIGTDQAVVVENDATIGEEVQILGGPFAGVNAIVTQVLPGRERIRILLELLGQQVEAEVHRDAVRAPKHHPLAE